MVHSNKQALANARKQTRNVPGTCQMATRNWFGAPSAGDRDKDGDADANDGWLSEPVSARVPGDRRPPEGAPLYFKNRDGSGFGHRCISENLAGHARSTDMLNGRFSSGNTSTCTIEQIERAMGLVYIGWSRTITGIPIPGLEKKAPAKPKPKTSRGVRVDKALAEGKNQVRLIKLSLKGAKETVRRRQLTLALKQAEASVKNLEKVPKIK